MQPQQSDAGPLPKNPGDDLSYFMDFGFQPELVENGGTEVFDSMVPPTFAVVSATEGSPALSFGGGVYSGTKAIATAIGGTSGTTYTVTVTATYESGHVRALTGRVQVIGA